MQRGAPSTAQPEPARSGEIVTRPDPGVARGKWEAPAWAFWVALVVVVVGATAYALRRFGYLRSPRGREKGAR